MLWLKMSSKIVLILLAAISVFALVHLHWQHYFSLSQFGGSPGERRLHRKLERSKHHHRPSHGDQFATNLSAPFTGPVTAHLLLHPTVLRSLRKSRGVHAVEQPKMAYATYVAFDEDKQVGAAVTMMLSLARADSRHDRVILVAAVVSDSTAELLTRFAHVVRVDGNLVEDPSKKEQQEEDQYLLVSTLIGLVQSWKLDDLYDRVAFLPLGTTIVQNCDDLFDVPGVGVVQMAPEVQQQMSRLALDKDQLTQTGQTIVVLQPNKRVFRLALAAVAKLDKPVPVSEFVESLLSSHAGAIGELNVLSPWYLVHRTDIDISYRRGVAEPPDHVISFGPLSGTLDSRTRAIFVPLSTQGQQKYFKDFAVSVVVASVEHFQPHLTKGTVREWGAMVARLLCTMESEEAKRLFESADADLLGGDPKKKIKKLSDLPPAPPPSSLEDFLLDDPDTFAASSALFSPDADCYLNAESSSPFSPRRLFGSMFQTQLLSSSVERLGGDDDSSSSSSSFHDVSLVCGVCLPRSDGKLFDILDCGAAVTYRYACEDSSCTRCAGDMSALRYANEDDTVKKKLRLSQSVAAAADYTSPITSLRFLGTVPATPYAIVEEFAHTSVTKMHKSTAFGHGVCQGDTVKFTCLDEHTVRVTYCAGGVGCTSKCRDRRVAAKSELILALEIPPPEGLPVPRKAAAAASTGDADADSMLAGESWVADLWTVHCVWGTNTKRFTGKFDSNIDVSSGMSARLLMQF